MLIRLLLLVSFLLQPLLPAPRKLPFDPEPLNYFFENRTEKCWVLDRRSNKNVVSVSASGFGMAAWAIAAKEGVISREQAKSWITQCLDNTVAANKGNHGWFYHFTDRAGNPVYYKSVASIDSGIFLACAKRAAEILDDNDLKKRSADLIAAVDLDFMLTQNGARESKKFFSHGFKWKNGQPDFLEYDWGDHYSEGIILYKLFKLPYQAKRVDLDLPLFVYYYPLCFFRTPDMIDLLGRAMDYQLEQHDILGYTACDCPNRRYGLMQADVISPLAIASCEPFFPEKVKSSWAQIPVAKSVPSYQLKTKWVSDDRIGIDDGAYLLMHYTP